MKWVSESVHGISLKPSGETGNQGKKELFVLLGDVLSWLLIPINYFGI